MTYADDVMRPEAPLFSPYLVRRDGRLFLVVPGQAGSVVRTFELSALQAARLAVDLHEGLARLASQRLAEEACTQPAAPVSTTARLPLVWSTQSA
jgi:hypothetical protein